MERLGCERANVRRKPRGGRGKLGDLQVVEVASKIICPWLGMVCRVVHSL